MATQLNEFNFNGAGRRNIYDWDKWLDGNIWELKRDVDFTCEAATMRNGARQAGRSRNVKVRTNVVDSNTLVIQSYVDVLDFDPF